MTLSLRQTFSGPAPNAEWQEISAASASGVEVALMIAPDAANSKRAASGLPSIFHAVLAQPTVARDASGSLRLSITFLLSRLPSPEEDYLAPLVERVTIGMDVTSAPFPAMLDTLSSDQREYRTLFPLETTYKLQGSDGYDVYAEDTVQNGQINTSLSGTFEREVALRLLDAINNKQSGLSLTAELIYRVPAATDPKRFSMDLARVHDFLATVATSDSIFFEVDLRNYLALMLEQGTVTFEGGLELAELDRDAVAAAALPAFLRAAGIIIRRVDEEVSPTLGQGYVLRPFAATCMAVQFLLSAEEAAHDSLAIAAPLHEVFSAVIQGQDLSPFINLVAIDEEGRGITPLPRRTRGTRARPRPLGNSIALAAYSNAAVSLSHAVRPSSTITVPAHAVFNAHPVLFQPNHLAVTNMTVHLAADRRRHLPVIDRKEDAIWPDRIDGDRRFWYVPCFEVMMPTATAQPHDSPYYFSFRTVGHDINGRPGLEAEIQFNLRPVITAEGQAKLDQLGGVNAQPVVTDNLSFVLEIPFRNEQGITVRERILASDVTEKDNHIQVAFRLLNDWVRLAYGSLAFSDFQPGEPARISAAYNFEAYIVIDQRKLELAAGGKGFTVPMVVGTRSTGEYLHVTMDDGVVHFPGGELHVKTGADQPRSRAEPSRVTMAVRPGAAMVAHFAAFRPELSVAPAIYNSLSRKKYAEGTQSWSSTVDVLVPCNTFGALYVEEGDDGAQAIGCQDTFHLGQTTYRLYEELLPQKPGYRIFRSLQTPGRFLVVPDVYVIGRYEPTEGEKAYRPLILFYSTIDIDDLSKSRCVFLATLQPDITLAERRQLLDELRADHHPQASLLYFTEIEGDMEIDWALPTTGGSGVLNLEAEETRDWDSFQVSLVTDAIGVPQLKAIMESSGISGSARLRLPDGTSLRSSLRLDLSRIAGPWLVGPLKITDAGGGTVEIRNAIESTVNVSELLVGDEEEVVLHPLGNRLAPGAKTEVDVSGTPTAILPIYSIEPSPSNLTEIRSYIEDITVGLVLINRFDLADLDLKRLEIDAEIQGVEGKQAVIFNPQSESAASIEFLLPLTNYLANPVVQFRARATDTGDQERQLATWQWPIFTNGVIVEISRELIGL